MAYGPIAACFGSQTRHFTGVTVTDGAGSPRSGIYADYADEGIKVIRAIEQKKAASIGCYIAQFLLAYPSAAVKDAHNRTIVDELKAIITACKPEVLYTHNLADKHDTHVAVAMHVIRALRELSPELRPKRVISMEVWRGLDWLCDEDKFAADTSAHPNLAAALLGVYDSQITGGKRYDLAAISRRVANATFFASHDVDEMESVSFGMDITGLVNGNASPVEFIGVCIDNFREEVAERVAKFT